MVERYPSAIELVEVGPRDGLQNEKRMLSPADKLILIERAIGAGSRRIEVTSFVNLRAVPQMADAEEVCAGLPRRADVTYIGLVMNGRGADRAIATGRIDQLGAVATATDRFGMANQGQTSQDSVQISRDIIDQARAAGLTGQATIAVAFGCPFEGEVSHDYVVEIASRLCEAGPVELALADTIGVADPAHVEQLVARVREAIAPIPVRVHFHNTRGTGLANVWAAIGAGASVVDASIGGLGGCPFAPAATGNVATEDVVYMLQRAGIETGLNLEALIDANLWLGTQMEKQLPSMVAKAGLFPAKDHSLAGARK